MARILLVEDEEDFRDAFMRVLEGKGYEVCAVENAENALEKLRSNHFDLVITDLLLPGMDGAELCRTLRADSCYAHLPILMISNMPQRLGIHITPHDARWAPLDRFMDKTAPLEDMARAVHELISQLGHSRG